MSESDASSPIEGRRSRAALLLAAFLFTGPVVAAEQPGPVVSIANDRVSLDVERMALSELLASLDRELPCSIRVSGDLTGLMVSASLREADIREALRQLLADQSYVLIEYGARVDSERVIDVILLRRTSLTTVEGMAGLGVEPASLPPRLEERPVEDLMQAALAVAPADERMAAVDAVAYASAGDATTIEQAHQVLVQALSDPDEAVRGQALETLKDTADELPLEMLSRMAREDASPARRIQALELLVERAEDAARGALRLALTDADTAVRERAAELTEDSHIELDQS